MRDTKAKLGNLGDGPRLTMVKKKNNIRLGACGQGDNPSTVVDLIVDGFWPSKPKYTRHIQPRKSPFAVRNLTLIKAY